MRFSSRSRSLAAAWTNLIKNPRLWRCFYAVLLMLVLLLVTYLKGRNSPTTCIAFRATAACTPYGPRRPDDDKKCLQPIKGIAGYCECGQGITVARVGCGAHRFTCAGQCAKYGLDPAEAQTFPAAVQCTPEQAYNMSLFIDRSTIRKQRLLTAPQLAKAAAAMHDMWSNVAHILERHKLLNITMPGVREYENDWVDDGKHMDRKMVQLIHNKTQSFIQDLMPYPVDSEGTPLFEGRGIAIVGGGMRYMVPAWNNIHMLRRTGCKLPIEMWFPVDEVPTAEVCQALFDLGVNCRVLDAPGMVQKGFAVKAVVLLVTRFKEVLLLDADNILVHDPTYLFGSAQWQHTGAMMWPDYWNSSIAPELPEILGIPEWLLPKGTHESGQIFMDKKRHWCSIQLALYMNYQRDVYPDLLTNFLGKGDKETFAYSILALNQSYYLEALPVTGVGVRNKVCEDSYGRKCRHEFAGNTMLQCDPTGKPLFLHTNLDKMNLQIPNEFSQYQRRWVYVLNTPTSLTPMKDWYNQNSKGVDLEHLMYRLVRAFRCASFFKAYAEWRRQKGDEFIESLEGFHSFPNGIVIPELGWYELAT